MKIVPLVFAFVVVGPACKGIDGDQKGAAPIEAGGLSPFGGAPRSVAGSGDADKVGTDDKDGAKADQEAKGDGESKGNAEGTPDVSKADQKGDRNYDGDGAKAEARPRDEDSEWPRVGPAKQIAAPDTNSESESKQHDGGHSDSGAAKGNAA